MKTSQRLIILGAFLSILFLAGCTDNGGQASVNVKQIANSGKLTLLGEPEHDWNDISIKGGLVQHTFNFRNDGTEDLYLKSAKTSCMCTQARYNLPGGSISPKYGMHTKPNSWSAAIKPGEAFSMDVWFDPMAHGPTATGPIRRTVTLMTSAESDGNLTKGISGSVNGSMTELFVSGNVLSEEDYESKYKS